MDLLVKEELLIDVVRRYQERACGTPVPGRFDQRVAGDALASTSEAYRERFVQDVLRLYGPGSAVHYKTEANDCLFLVDRELAQAASTV